MFSRRLAGAAILAVLAGASTLLAQSAPSADAARMAEKLAAIAARGATPGQAPPLSTSFTDREVNAYFQVVGPEFLPDGLANPRVEIGQDGRLLARAIVDLNAALKPQERSWLDPLAWVGGKVEVRARGRLKAAGGRGQFALDEATLGGVAIPKPVLQELISYYSRSDTNPAGFNLDEPFDLPAGIREVRTNPGRATVVQ